MIIQHKIDDFLFEVFDISSKDINALEMSMKQFYNLGSYKPIITFLQDTVKIELSINSHNTEQNLYRKLVVLSESSKFKDARDCALELIKKAPHNSEYHRILGQVSSELGNQEEAINSLKLSLKWNSSNEWALLMMGNIFAKYKKDIKKALRYYNQVLIIKPDDVITLTNIGANLMQLGNTSEATSYFKKAIVADPTYPNTHYAIALLSETEHNYNEAFLSCLTAIKNIPSYNGFYETCLKFTSKIASKLHGENDPKIVLENYAAKLAKETGVNIRIIEDDAIASAAKIEFAEIYNRDYHLVRYKSDYPCYEHLALHELTHLELVHEARKQNRNKLFTSDSIQKTAFANSLKKELGNLRKQGVAEKSISSFMAFLFNGLNLQVYNTPIDLFIEDKIYNDYENFRPSQYLSLTRIINDGVIATTNKDTVKSVPKNIISKSKIYNLVIAMHFKDLFHVDYIDRFKPSRDELNQAENFFNDFIKLRHSRKASEEYDLVQNWATILNLDPYFTLIAESKYKLEHESMDFSEEGDHPSEAEKMELFLKQHGGSEINTAVTMYMVDALQKLEKLPIDMVKQIAFEIANIGNTGIDPGKEGYHIPSIAGSSFSGYKTLAYYYVSWALALPEMLISLQLPFDDEYRFAQQLIKD